MFGGFGQQFGAQAVAEGIARNLEVVGLAPRTVDMDDEFTAQRRIDRSADLAQVGRGIGGGGSVDMHRFVRNAQRDAAVDDIDRAADGRAAIEQAGGAAQHLDPVGGQRVDGDRVVGGGVGSIDRADAVGEDPHSLALEAAQHGARGAGRKTGGRHAGQVREHVADLARHLALKLDPADDRGTGQHVQPADAAAGDDDLGAVEVVVVIDIVRRRRRLGLLGMRGERHQRGSSAKKEGQAASGLSMI